MPLYSSKGLDKFSLKQEENNTINAEIPYQFQEKHEETLPYQEYSPTYQEYSLSARAT
jgi:hypothetical protein